MPMRLRSWFRSTPGAMMLRPSSSASPLARWPGYRSYMRFNTRSSVLLPQPDGPIMPVTLRSGRSRLMPFSARFVP
jgi:hypothetical protein